MTDPAPEYVAARRVLLDALTALRGHLDNLILVGAQAVYHHTGDTDLNVPVMTTDADLAIDKATAPAPRYWRRTTSAPQRIARGLEPALVDHELVTLTALDPTDTAESIRTLLAAKPRQSAAGSGRWDRHRPGSPGGAGPRFDGGATPAGGIGRPSTPWLSQGSLRHVGFTQT